MEWKGLDNVAHPFKSHPQEILKKHPLDSMAARSVTAGRALLLTRNRRMGSSSTGKNR